MIESITIPWLSITQDVAIEWHVPYNNQILVLPKQPLIKTFTANTHLINVNYSFLPVQTNYINDTATVAPQLSWFKLYNKCT